MSTAHPLHCPNVTAALAAFRAGRPVLLLDDDDREDEADIIAAAENISLQTMAMMIRDCSGIVCLCLDEATVDALALAPMVQHNQARHGTGFTVTIEAAEGITTGVSAQDRITTIQAALASSASERRIVSPGHVFPLRARDGGVLTRRGHTEGSVDLARLAGLRPAAVLCELMNPDGSMARGEQVAAYARQHDLPVLTIEELARYRLALRARQAEAVV
ncbi:3,4-dihydroxy-2-butanone-4-phosphate synthase [Pseudomonas entomophila]|uniref:3,4-dihydroxy-2-butanone-4-phosphate synthase n=1 Tax=Pseudomonas entomophila TaxID=312306 RepID=UPI0015E3161A|nr:3,4-dihydroxy-2-butanone-4-phosphate synthase [Pseudomonas entomophila]MBA1189836.1 3,4-dihydroxy-2-butanone-4-phosphate synthase [Pseudomonas entomophila]